MSTQKDKLEARRISDEIRKDPENPRNFLYVESEEHLWRLTHCRPLAPIEPSPQSSASIHESARRNPKSDFNEGGMT